MRHTNQIIGGLSALILGLGWGGAVAAEQSGWPAVEGAVFALPDANVTTTVTAFDTKGRSLLAFNLADRGRALQGRFYELVCDGGSFHAAEGGAWVGAKVAEAGEFSMEATLSPASAAPVAPGTIVAFADDKQEDFALVQDKAGLALRFAGGDLISIAGVKPSRPIHVLVSCGKQEWSAYVDGKLAKAGPAPKGAAAWGQRQLFMGSDSAGKQPWFGRMEAVAIFPRALSKADATKQASVMTAMHAARKPANQLRFEGTLVRQAETSSVEEIRPYTRSLTMAEYKVDKVLEGEWSKPNVTVFHWMIMGGERLPIADRKPGAKVVLTVEPLEEHPQLESSRRDELAEVDLDAAIYYCESEGGSVKPLKE